MNLSLVSQAMTSQSLTPGSVYSYSESADADDQGEDRKSKLMRRGFVLLFAALVFIILMAVGGDEVHRISNRLGHLIDSLVALGVAVLLAGTGLIIYAGLLPPLEVRRRLRRRQISPPAPTIDYPDDRLNTASMEREPDRAPSVTEHTTYTLDQPKPDAN
jgi:hypothetical protein